MKRLELAGKKFGKWTVVEIIPKIGSQKLFRWKCICECGKEGAVLSDNLTRGISTSCGCWGREKTLKSVTLHGLSKHPLHSVWRGILARCYNSNNPSYSHYGGRGVKVCPEWLEFINFYNWANENGWKKGLQIDKDIKARKAGVPALVYSPEMCSIVTPKTNSRTRKNSRLITCRGMTMTLAEFAELVGEKSDIIHYRMRHGWTEEEAIFTPFKRRKNA